MRYARIVLLVPSLIVTGCGSTPVVTVNYYLPKIELELTVIQTAACTSDRRPLLTSDIVILPKYSRDSSQQFALKLQDLDGTLTKGDVGFTFYEDGRLKGLNSSQTGLGGEVIKAALALRKGLGLFATDAAQCAELQKLNPKTVTVKHLVRLDFAAPSPVTMERQSLTDSQFNKVKAIFGDNVKVSYTIGSGPSLCMASNTSSGTPHCGEVPVPDEMTLVTLRTPTIASVTVIAGPSSKQFVFKFDVPVPQKGQLYTLPIASPPLFGSTRFSVELSPSGTVTSLKYGKDSGVAASLTAATDIDAASAATPVAAKAAAIKAEADLIAQQQRLIRCQAKPTECT